IPGGHYLAALDLVTFLHREGGAIGHLVTFTLTTNVVGHSQLGGTGYHHQTCLVLHMLDVAQAHLAAMLDLDAGHGGSTAGRTTDVEGTHGELGARFTDGLGRHDADRFPDVDAMTTRQVTTIALGAHTPACFTADDGAHQHFVHTKGFQLVNLVFVEQGAAFEQHLIGARLDHVGGNHTTQHTIAQRLNHITAFDQRRHQDAVFGTAIVFVDHQILGHIHQTAGE